MRRAFGVIVRYLVLVSVASQQLSCCLAYLGCHEWYEQFMMCALVMGGNGSVAIPPSADSIISSSITAGIFAILADILSRVK
jgi:hypothetical protein